MFVDTIGNDDDGGTLLVDHCIRCMAIHYQSIYPVCVFRRCFKTIKNTLIRYIGILLSYVYILALTSQTNQLRHLFYSGHNKRCSE